MSIPPDRRVSIRRRGGYDRLEIETFEAPPPRAREIRVSVAAIGVNYADCVVRMGLYASARHYVGWPITPGFEVAGRVDAIGDEVTGFGIGDEVFAVTRFGGYATRLCLPDDQVFRRPEGWSLAEAAAFPTVHLTAHHALFQLAHLEAGQMVLIHSGAGGVGSALVRLVRLAGATSVAVVGHPDKIPIARRLGADDVVDKSTERLEAAARRAAPEGYDVVLDANGASTLRSSYRLLRPTGRLVIYGFHSMLPRRGGRPSYAKLALDFLRTPRFNPLDLTGDNKSVLGFNLSYLFERKDLLQHAMTELMGWVADGDLPAPEIRTWPLDDVAAAHQALESGMTTGKLVLLP